MTGASVTAAIAEQALKDHPRMAAIVGAAHVPDLPRHCGSWVIVRRDTGQGVLETFSRAVCERVNASSYEVLTTLDYLGRLNARIRANDAPAWART